LVIALAGASAFAANDKRILAKDDIEFAEALKKAGYRDLSDSVFAAIERTSGGTGDTALAVAVTRLKGEKEDAEKEPDLRKRVDLLAKLVEATEAFAQAHQGTEAGNDATDSLPSLYQAVGETTAAALQTVTQPTEAADMRAKGGKMFERAIDALQKQIADLAAKRHERAEKGDDPDPALEQAYMTACYTLARTYYFHGLLLEPGSFARTNRLESALKVINDFSIDFSDQLICYEAFIYEGLCYKELGKPDKVIESFDSAIALRDFPDFEKNAKGVYQLSGPAADLVSSAVLQKALFLSDKGDFAGALAAIKDYFTTTPEPEQALKGLALLVLEAETYGKLGDQKSLETVAKHLIEIDPRGVGGARGRELLGEGGSSALGASDMLRLAEQAIADKDFDRAISVYQQVIISARGSPDQANICTQAGVSLGALLSRTDVLAAVAVWDTIAERFQQGKDASECLWRTVQGYSSLQAAEHRPYYKVHARERMATLVSRYPKSQYAPKAAILEGQFLEGDGDFAGAAAIYEAVPAGSPNFLHEEGMYRAGNAWTRQATKLFQGKKTADGKQAVAKAEADFQKAKTALDAAAAGTLDTKAQDFLTGLAFNARMGIVNLYLMKEVNRPGDVVALVDEAEQKYSTDTDKVAAARALRMKAFIALGKVDEAMTLLDAQIKKNPDSMAAGPSAAALAQVLDTRGAELRKKDPNSAEAETLWQKAANYYYIAIKAQVDGKEPIVRIDEYEAIVNRLYVLALHFDRVPDDVDSFIDWTGTPKSDDLFERVAAAYEAELANTPSNLPRIKLARSHGFLGQWEKASTRYAEVFDQEHLIDASGQFNQTVLRQTPELLPAYLEWGVCEREVGVATADQARLKRASTIFENLLLGSTKGGKTWWQAKYFQIRTMLDRGDYDHAGLAMRDVERNNQDFDDNKYNLRDRFHKLRDEVARKVDPANAPPPDPTPPVKKPK
jgi:tetratricopeptide (TPR) repeat protein